MDASFLIWLLEILDLNMVKTLALAMHAKKPLARCLCSIY
jgi:hypothetical protein